MISILSFLFVFGILIFIHEFGHFIFAKKNGVKVEKFAFGFGPRLWGKQVGDTEYRINLIPLGGYVKMAGDEPDKNLTGASWEYLSKSCGARAQIIAAGPVLNYTLAFLLFSFIFMIGAPTMTNKVGKLIDDYPAQAAGIKDNDEILKVNGTEVTYWDDITEIIRNNEESKIELEIKRKERVLNITVRPTIKEVEDIFGKKTKINMIGIYPHEDMVTLKYGFFKSFKEGGKKLIYLTGVTCKALWYVVTRRLSFKESFSGPIGIFVFTGKAAQLGFIYLLNLMALFSMSLAIFNVLPVPVLDGGHLFFLLIERIRRKPLSMKVQGIASQIGITALVALMLMASYYDVKRSGWIEKAQEYWNEIKSSNN